MKSIIENINQKEDSSRSQKIVREQKKEEFFAQKKEKKEQKKEKNEKMKKEAIGKVKGAPVSEKVNQVSLF